VARAAHTQTPFSANAEPHTMQKQFLLFHGQKSLQKLAKRGRE